MFHLGMKFNQRKNSQPSNKNPQQNQASQPQHNQGDQPQNGQVQVGQQGMDKEKLVQHVKNARSCDENEGEPKAKK